MARPSTEETYRDMDGKGVEMPFPGRKGKREGKRAKGRKGRKGKGRY